MFDTHLHETLQLSTSVVPQSDAPACRVVHVLYVTIPYMLDVQYPT